MNKRGFLRRRACITMFAAIAASATVAAPATDTSSSVAATAASTPGLEEIIVTARKRDEKAIDVPFSLQVVDDSELTKLGAIDFSDYARTIAGVSFEDKGAGRWTIFMRGVSTGSDVDTGKQSSVGMYFDETPISESSSQPDIKLYDVSRVEVLRGPQGTLFGSGSLSGTLRVIPKAPELNSLSGEAGTQLSVTEHGGLNYSLDGVLNLPLSDVAAVRVVGYKIGDAGFLKNGFSGAEDVGYEHTNGARAAILLKPTDQLDITLSGIFQDSGFGEYYQVTDHYPALIIDEAEPEPFQDEYRLGALKINYDFGPSKLTSVTSYYDRRRFFLNDIDYFTGLIGVPRAYSPLTYTARTVSQEFRLASTGTGPLGWLVGAYFEDDHEEALQSASPAGEPVPPPADQLVDINRVTNYRQYALFGEVNYEISPKLTATAGVRVSRIRGDNTSIDNGLLYGGESIKTGNNDNNPVTPRVILSYMPNRDWQIYAQASKGFRIGGVNPGLPPCLPQNGCTVDVKSTFNPDTVWNYELGTKSAMLDGRISFDADVFYIDWSNIQLSVDRGDGFNGFMNIGKATVKGVELSVRAALTEHWHTGGQFTYTDGKITELGPGIAATGTVAVGDAVPAVPRVSTSGFLEWGTHVAGDGWLYIRGDVSYITTRYGDFAATQPIPLLPYSIGNLRVGLDEGPNSVSVFVNNVTDRRAMLAVQNYSGVHDGEPYSWLRYNINIPRTVGIAFTRRF
jgi:iron complex outermembrane receptor protein